MTKATSIPKPSQAPRQKRVPESAGTSEADACELLVAELRARRERLQHLLTMIHRQVASVPAAPAPLPSRRKCSAARRMTAV